MFDVNYFCWPVDADYSCRVTLYLGFGVQKSLHSRRVGVRQTGVPQVIGDRTGAGVAASLPNQSPNGCVGQHSPHLAMMGQQFAGV